MNRRRWAAVAAIAAAALVVLGPIGGAATSATSKPADGSCEATASVPASPSPAVQARLETLHGRFAGLDGFVDVYVVPDREPSHVAVFVGEVPVAAHLVETSVPVALRSVPDAPEPAPAGSSQPSQEDIQCYAQIRPGSPINGGCTLGFIYKNTTDGDADYFATTAGHCLSEGQKAKIPGYGLFGLTVFSTGSGGVGHDFAVIDIYDIFEDDVNGEMCTVGGPTGPNEDAILGEPVVHSGVGQVVGFPFDHVVPPRPRAGVGTLWGATSFAWYGAAIPGDSGSAIRLRSGGALGVITHLGGTLLGTNVGTTWAHGLDLADDDPDVPGNLTLVTGPRHV